MQPCDTVMLITIALQLKVHGISQRFRKQHAIQIWNMQCNYMQRHTRLSKKERYSNCAICKLQPKWSYDKMNT